MWYLAVIIVVVVLLIYLHTRAVSRSRGALSAPIDEFIANARTGDLIFANYDNASQYNYAKYLFYDVAMFAASGHVYTHVAMVYRAADGEILIMQIHPYPHYDVRKRRYVRGELSLIDAHEFINTYYGDVFWMPAKKHIDNATVDAYLAANGKSVETSLFDLVLMLFGRDPPRDTLVCTRPVADILETVGITSRLMPGRMYTDVAPHYEAIRYISL